MVLLFTYENSETVVGRCSSNKAYSKNFANFTGNTFQETPTQEFS